MGYLLALNKAAHMSSHDVVHRLRAILSEKRIGHAGTLDPDAEGVLLVAVGSATRLCQFLSSDYKTYEVCISFGYETDTDDAAGKPRLKQEVEDRNLVSRLQDPSFFRNCLAEWNDLRYPQLPPRVSAIHVGGKRAYELERLGEQFELTPRMIHIKQLELLEIIPGEQGCFCQDQVQEYFRVKLRIELSKGGYVRSFARDLGRKLACPAHVYSLRRLRSGAVGLEESVSLEDIALASDPRACALDPCVALGFCCVELTEQELAALMHGNCLFKRLDAETCACLQPGDKLSLIYKTQVYAIAECQKIVNEELKLQPRVVFQEGIEGVAYSNRNYLSRLEGIHKRWKLYDCSEDFKLAKPREDIKLEEVVCSLGVFDGFHLGHRYLIERMTADARARALPSVIISFETDPDELLHSSHKSFSAPLWKTNTKLQTNEERLRYLHEAGAQYLLRIPFTPELAALSYDEFLCKLSEDFFKLAALHVGDNFKLGAHGQGDLSSLKSWGLKHACTVVGHPLVRQGSYTVSSTTIRSLLKAGKPELAARLLGRAYRIQGKVVHGRGKGRSFGFPTANIQEFQGELIPAEGVYAGYIVLKDSSGHYKRYPAAISVGEAPSFQDEDCAHIEVFILGFSGKIYRSVVELEFIQRLREMRKFGSVDELIATVEHNIDQVAQLLGNTPEPVAAPSFL